MGRLFDPPKPPPVYMPPPPTLPPRFTPMPEARISGPAPEPRNAPTPPVVSPHPTPAPATPPAPTGGTAGTSDDGRRQAPRRRWRPDTLVTGWRGVLDPREGGPRRKTLLGE